MPLLSRSFIYNGGIQTFRMPVHYGGGVQVTLEGASGGRAMSATPTTR